MRNFASVDTTMGFSTPDGLVMGTRPGSIDPGILLYLLKERGYSPELLEQLLYRQSGLLKVSGISSDVAELLASNAKEASEALDLFAFQVSRQTVDWQRHLAVLTGSSSPAASASTQRRYGA